MLQEWLQELAEEELPASQCGFGKTQGCMEMVFTVRQLVESWKHTSKAFFTFLDLRKAYDYVLRDALCVALKKIYM